MSTAQVQINWTKNLAYIVGLITSDGCLSKDNRHIDFTSKDLEQMHNFIKILNLKNKIGIKRSKKNEDTIYYRIQFGNVIFYKFLLEIGLTPKKSKTIGEIQIPEEYFSDYLRGLFDGDGFSLSYWDKKWKNSFRLYSGFVSASRQNLEWLQNRIIKLYKIYGTINNSGGNVYQLRFAKYASIDLYNILYYKKDLIYLKRKKFKFERSLCIIEEQNKRKC